jgi:hypothetical protein
MVNKSFTKIPLEQLDYIRLTLRAELKQLETTTGEKYAIRTFYLGPRPYRSRNTVKSAATAAKLGVYQVKESKYSPGYTYTVLDRYL